LGTTTLPYFDDLTKTPQHGLSCGGCQVAVELGLVTPTRDGWQFRDRVYSCDGFLRHFQWCAQAQDLWKSSLEGDSNPTKSEWIRRGGWIWGKMELLCEESLKTWFRRFDCKYTRHAAETAEFSAIKSDSDIELNQRAKERNNCYYLI